MNEKTPAWVYLAALAPPAAIVAIAAIQPWVPFDQLIRDSIEAAKTCARSNPELAVAGKCAKNYFGLLSNLGVLLWCVTASICLYSYLRSVRTDHRGGSGRLLAYAGVFSALLMLDDFFLGHDLIYPRVFGLKEEYVFAMYGAALIAYLAMYFRAIAKLEYSVLLISMFFFATSLFFDLYHKIGLFAFIDDIIVKDGLAYTIGEDGAKFVGIWAWAVFHVRAAWILSVRADKPPEVARNRNGLARLFVRPAT